MAYLGNTPTTQSFISGTDYFNGTGSQTAFTLSRTVNSINDIQAVVNNVVQQPNDAYTLSGTTITFTSAPSSGTNNVYVRYLSTTTQTITPSQGTAVTSLVAGNGIAVSSATDAVTVTAVGSTINSQTTGYTLLATDAGKVISITTGGVTIPNSVLSAGNIVTIYNNSGSSQTITQGSGVTLQWAGQASSSTGNRTLGLYGMATVVYITASNAVITGSGLT